MTEPMSGCAHRGKFTLKFDGGRSAVLCEDCRTVVGYLYRTMPEVGPQPGDYRADALRMMPLLWITAAAAAWANRDVPVLAVVFLLLVLAASVAVLAVRDV